MITPVQISGRLGPSLRRYCVSNPMLNTVFNADREPSKRSFSCITSQIPREDTKYTHGFSHTCQLVGTRHQRSYVSDIVGGMAQTGFYCFNTMHNMTGLPWWISIGLVVVPMRAGLQLFKEYYDRRNAHRLGQVSAQMKKVIPHIRALSSKIGSEGHDIHRKADLAPLERIREQDFNTKVKATQQMLYQKLKCHPWKNVAVGILHVPIWLSLSFSLREMAGLRYLFNAPREHVYQASLHTGGVLWFPDLVVPDPFLILPVVAVLSMLTSIEISKLRQMSMKIEGPTPTFMKVLNVLPWVGCGVLLLFGAYFPAAMTFYWSVSTLSANVVTIVLLSPKVQKTFNFKPLPFDSKTPYTELYSSMKIRYNPKNWYEKINTKFPRLKSINKGTTDKEEGK